MRVSRAKIMQKNDEVEKAFLERAAGGGLAEKTEEEAKKEEEKSEEQEVVRKTRHLALLTLVSRILGLFREMTKAWFLGTGWLSDAFSSAFVLPNFVRRLFAEGAVSTGFIPGFKRCLAEKGSKDAGRFASSSLTLLGIAGLAATLLGYAFAPALSGLFGTERAETTLLLRIMFPFLATTAVAALFQGVLNTLGSFWPSALASILFNLIAIAIPWAFPGWLGNPARRMAFGVLAGGVAQILCQLPALRKTGLDIRLVSPRRAFGDKDAVGAFKAMLPTILGMAAYHLNDITGTIFAARVGTGTTSSLQYSLRLQEFILGIFAVSAGTVVLPTLVDRARRASWPAFSSLFGRALRDILFVSIPTAAFSILLGEQLVGLLFQGGSFTGQSARLTASIFVWHQAGLVFIAANKILLPAFLALGDTRTPALAGLASFFVNLLLAAALHGRFGGQGIAFSLSFSALVNTAALAFRLRTVPVPGLHAELAASFRWSLRLLGYSLAASVPVWFLKSPLLALFSSSSSRLLSLGLPLVILGTVFAGVGVGLIVAVKDPEGEAVAAKLRARFRKR